MRVGKTIIACMVLTFVVVSIMAMAQSAKLEGVWRITEVTLSGSKPETLTNLPPWSLFIFTKKHYSIMYVSATADKPRPDLPQDNATDAQKAAAWTPFTANAGTFEAEGTTLTVHPTVAKNPNAMKSGASNTYVFKIEGNTLLLTPKTMQARPVENPMTMKLMRLE